MASEGAGLSAGWKVTAARRFLTRHFHEGTLQRMNARIKADPSLMRQRRCAAEHPSELSNE